MNVRAFVTRTIEASYRRSACQLQLLTEVDLAS